MRKHFTRALCALALLLCASASASAVDVTVAGQSFPGYQFGGSKAFLRIYASGTFTASDGTIVGGGTAPGSTLGFYSLVTCSVASSTLTCPAVTLKSTTDSTDAPDTTYLVKLFDANGTPRDFFPLPASFRLWHTLGANATWGDVANANSTHPRAPQPGYYDAGQVDSKINSAVAVGDPATTTANGRVRASVAPADPTSPVAVGQNDLGWPSAFSPLASLWRQGKGDTPAFAVTASGDRQYESYVPNAIRIGSALWAYVKGTTQIHAFRSDDNGATWTYVGVAVSPGPPGSWNSSNIVDPTVVYDKP
ncbi:MAG: hypothetical protein M3348_17600, partial [Acidobacteriota bacterium]|nr:hypothetical protein [Acidobacteriota bacterium]